MIVLLCLSALQGKGPARRVWYWSQCPAHSFALAMPFPRPFPFEASPLLRMVAKSLAVSFPLFRVPFPAMASPLEARLGAF
eukprot:8625857-Heterocapsa_arctica.AAC.1